MSSIALYIHIPWCIRKCPYCDFNSHKSPDYLPEESYIKALLADFSLDQQEWFKDEITSIFIGGGTPSLFSGQAMHQLLDGLRDKVKFSDAMEITLEANPGTVEQQRFKEYRNAGINRLSLGIQSFNAKHLKKLGRIHDDLQAHRAIESARKAGFDNINLDLMHGLPDQTLEEGLQDLRIALDHAPEHLSWYQLTLEPNTLFYKQRPVLPSEDTIDALEQGGLDLLAANDFHRYEISAFCKPHFEARHNLNYWLFGDYYGIGAGAHGKITDETTKAIYRTQKHRQPQDYLNTDKPYRTSLEVVSEQQLCFEFMLNATRLQQAIPHSLFTQRTGLNRDILQPGLELASQKGLIQLNSDGWQITDFGRRFTNDLQAIFL